RKGRGSGRVAPATVTARSCIASRSADCVLGEARLTSSASTRLANTGPGRNRNSRPPSPLCSSTWVPTMSAGMRSGVNWTRLNSRSTASDRVLSSMVLPSPGTPSSNAWPSQSRQTSTVRTSSRWPTMTRPICSSMAAASAAHRSGVMVSAEADTVVTVGLPGVSQSGRALEVGTDHVAQRGGQRGAVERLGEGLAVGLRHLRRGHPAASAGGRVVAPPDRLAGVAGPGAPGAELLALRVAGHVDEGLAACLLPGAPCAAGAVGVAPRPAPPALAGAGAARRARDVPRRAAAALPLTLATPLARAPASPLGGPPRAPAAGALALPSPL